ncbi:hypothetical protein BTA51_21450 [Hahella sp. CCB-MM4]|uniref:hypothetical protein n=1 Tax=Hahella sp. (strain CCB-MM4) TaxID=1926491 RepID=UPI000B9A8E94|nr:hypothetical protein [Hahella sp. CCB-MM4]OZG71218.1 hypothetical protein BTA51_21450 [Hahella sp. CCB-MM4]
MLLLRSNTILMVILSILILIPTFILAPAVKADIAVIVNPNSELSLSPEDIQNLFLAKKAFFPNGNKATLVTVESSSALFEEFCHKVVNRRPRQFLSYWARLVFTGKAAPMIRASSDQDIKVLISQNPNYIGFISTSELDDSVRSVQQY